MLTISSEDAAAQFPQLLDRVAGGEAITIVRDGQPVASMIGVRPPCIDPDQVQATIDAIKRDRQHRSATQAELREWMTEGRR